MSIYIPRHFEVFELVDKATYLKFKEMGNARMALRYFRREILVALDWIWENYPCKIEESRSITVNDWYWHGSHQWRGLRLPASPDFKPYSAHSYGAGIDFEANHCDDEEMQAWLIKEHDKKAPHPEYFGVGDAPVLNIRRMEKGTAIAGPRGWTHIDCLEHGARDLLLVNP